MHFYFKISFSCLETKVLQTEVKKDKKRKISEIVSICRLCRFGLLDTHMHNRQMQSILNVINDVKVAKNYRGNLEDSQLVF